MSTRKEQGDAILEQIKKLQASKATFEPRKFKTPLQQTKDFEKSVNAKIAALNTQFVELFGNQ